MARQLTKKQIFESFIGLLTGILSKYYIHQYILRKKDKSGIEMRGFFWLTLLDGFQENILLGLSNIFDTGVHSIKCITIYKLIENYDDIKIKQLLRKKVDKHNKTIENLIIWRGHYLAHKNELFVAKITNLSEKFPIKWGEITDLLNLCIDVVSKTPRNFDEKDATSYKKYYQINRRKCEQDTKFVFEYGLDTPEYRKLKRKK